MNIIKAWIRRLIFNLIREEIELLILNTKAPKLQWEVAPKLEKPKSEGVISWAPHPSLPGKLLVVYSHPTGRMRECVEKPKEDLAPEAMTEYLLSLPEAHLTGH